MSLITIGTTAFALAALTQIINKLLINEKFVDETKEKMKKIQKELKEIDKNSKEFKEKQEKLLEMNFAIMKQQFKPMFITFLPYILAFYILSGMFSYAPIEIGSQVHIEINGIGKINLECLGINRTISGMYSTDAVVNSECKDIDLIGKKEIVSINKDGFDIKITPPKAIFINLPFNLPIFGNKIGWLGTFIIFSFLSSFILNKALKGIYLRKWE